MVKEVRLMKKPKVLVADDSESSRLMAQYCLTQLGCESDFVNDGQETLDKLKKNHYDLIIIDWNMPHMSGRETLIKAEEILKELNRDQTAYVLIYSGLPMSHLNIPISKWVHVSGYLSKEFSPHKQMMVFKKYIDLVNRERQKRNGESAA